MEKKKYYVSVQSKSLSRDQGQAAYEWEIEASDAEAEELGQLLLLLEESEHATFFRGMTPGVPYHMDLENDGYDGTLRHVLGRIHALGTPDTKAQLANIADRLTGLGEG